MVSPTCFGIILPSSGSVPSAFWEMLKWGAVDRILWMGVLCLVTWYACANKLNRFRPVSTLVDITSNTFYKCTATFPTQICRKCLRIILNVFRHVSTLVNITSNTIYTCTTTFRRHCIYKRLSKTFLRCLIYRLYDVVSFICYPMLHIYREVEDTPIMRCRPVP
jgi:hypothetical protein